MESGGQMEEATGLGVVLSFAQAPQGASPEEKAPRENRPPNIAIGSPSRLLSTKTKNTSKPKKESKSLDLSLSQFAQRQTIADGSEATIVAARTVRGTTARKHIFDKDVVLKSIPKFQVSRKVRQYLHREIEVHLRVGSHPNIATLYASFEDENGVYLVLERIYGPTLHSVIRNSGVLSEKFALQTIDQLLEAICFMHSRGFSHRDISSKNIMFREWPSPSTGNFHLLLIDLGHACYSHPDADVVSKLSSEKIGTLHFTAPEVHRDPNYRPELCDMWSIGVLLYMMLTGNYPYTGKTEGVIVRAIQETQLRLDGERWDSISDATKDIIRRLLRPSPFMRPDAERLKREVQGALRNMPLQDPCIMEDPVEKPYSERNESDKRNDRASKEGKRVR